MLLARKIEVLDPLDREIAAAAAGERLELIAKYVRRCVLCPLYRHRRHAVPGEGGGAARLVIVGEAPGGREDLEGRPFVGRAGELLDELFAVAGLKRRDAFITNVVKCRAVRLAAGRNFNRAPSAREVGACRPYLVRQVEVIRPRIILCLGATAARGVIAADFDLSRQRGQWFAGPQGSRLIATFHPAYLLRHGGRGWRAPELRRAIESDLAQVSQRLAGP